MVIIFVALRHRLQGIAVVADGFAVEGIGRFPSGEEFTLQRAFDDDLVRGGFDCGIEEVCFFGARRFQFLDKLEFLVDKAGFLSCREHGIEIDHVYRVQQFGHAFYAVALDKFHPGGDIL